MEKIGTLYTNFGGEKMKVEEAEAKRKDFNKKALDLLNKLAEKDPTVSINSDNIGDTMQAIAFTKNGRIIIYNNSDSIIIEHEGKEDIKLSSLNEEDALDKIQSIVNG